MIVLIAVERSSEVLSGDLEVEALGEELSEDWDNSVILRVGCQWVQVDRRELEGALKAVKHVECE